MLSPFTRSMPQRLCKIPQLTNRVLLLCLRLHHRSNVLPPPCRCCPIVITCCTHVQVFFTELNDRPRCDLLLILLYLLINKNHAPVSFPREQIKNILEIHQGLKYSAYCSNEFSQIYVEKKTAKVFTREDYVKF